MTEAVLSCERPGGAEGAQAVKRKEEVPSRRRPDYQDRSRPRERVETGNYQCLPESEPGTGTRGTAAAAYTRNLRPAGPPLGGDASGHRRHPCLLRWSRLQIVRDSSLRILRRRPSHCQTQTFLCVDASEWDDGGGGGGGVASERRRGDGGGSGDGNNMVADTLLESIVSRFVGVPCRTARIGPSRSMHLYYINKGCGEAVVMNAV